MLSRLFTSAKTLLKPTSQTQGTGDSDTSIAEEEMVTTRQMGRPAEDVLEDSIVVEIPTPESSRKRQRGSVDGEDNEEEHDVDISESASKRVKQLPVRVKDDDESHIRSTRLVVEIPVSKSLLQQTRGSSVARSSKSPVVKPVDEIADSEESEDEEAKVVDNDFENEDEISREEKETPEVNSVLKTPEISPKKLPSTQNHQDSIEEVLPNSAAVKPKHKRFGSEEPEAEIFSTAAEKIEIEEESSDEDDAPEVVGTQAAQKTAELKARDAAKAIDVQESAIKQKRKERDAVLKKQAEAAGKKRKRAIVEEIMPNPEKTKRSEGTQNFARGPLPDFLPAEFLEDNDEEPQAPSGSELPVRKVRKMKFTDLIEKNPKDLRKGSTTYRVSEVRSTKLAPKASFQARSLKESWLQGRPGSVLGTNRKPWSSGFLRNGRDRC